ncbi:cytochrome-1 [Diaporthe helianthi]|uniref:Cytochrome-1 n=1 Tax=Diaporthe helianthi TaxID=158607 RepID=A0A2P5HXL0_DIAHE|nr:cytochrome-1 [Diaporthe helianthi]
MASHLPHVMASALFLAASLIGSVSAATPTNGVEFLFPTQGITFHHNDYVQVQYTSEFEAPWLYTFCRAASGSVSQKQDQGVGGYNSTALIKLSWSGSDTPCWFNLKPSAGAAVGKGANSDNWSFDMSERAATTAALSTSASPTPTPSVTSLSSSSPTTKTASETSTQTSSDVSTATLPDETTAAVSLAAEPTPKASDASVETVSHGPTSDSDGLATSTTSAAAETSSASSTGLSMGAQIGTGIGVAIAGAALAQCLQESECVMVQRNSAADCLRSPLAETLPTKCQQLKKGFGECRRGMIDMRKRFRGNQPAAFKNLQESDATGEGYQLYAGKSAFGGTRGETAGDGKAPPDWRDLENAKYRSELESKKS